MSHSAADPIAPMSRRAILTCAALVLAIAWIIVAFMAVWAIEESDAAPGTFMGLPMEVGQYPQIPTFGNVCAYENSHSTEGGPCLPDCTFAAAAEWEILELGYTPNPARIEAEWKLAGGNSEGLDPEVLWSFWRQHGIAGVHAHVHELKGLDDLEYEGSIPAREIPRLKRYIDEYHVLLAGAWSHEFVINGYSPRGVLYFTYGEEREETWAEWLATSEEVSTVSVVNRPDGVLALGRRLVRG